MARNGFRILDSDLHIMEPPDLWQRYMDPSWAHAAPDCPRYFGRRTEEMGAARDVGKGLVDGNPHARRGA